MREQNELLFVLLKVFSLRVPVASYPSAFFFTVSDSGFEPQTAPKHEPVCCVLPKEPKASPQRSQSLPPKEPLNLFKEPSNLPNELLYKQNIAPKEATHLTQMCYHQCCGSRVEQAPTKTITTKNNCRLIVFPQLVDHLLHKGRHLFIAFWNHTCSAFESSDEYIFNFALYTVEPNSAPGFQQTRSRPHKDSGSATLASTSWQRGVPPH